MLLQCARCRDRKLKCDREEPECRRCQGSGVQCLYPEKRKARGSRHRTEIHRLDQRLETLEERLKKDSPSTQGTTAFLYKMVSGAKDSIKSLTNQSRFASKPAQSTVNNAITRLDTALDQLAAPSPHPGMSVVDKSRDYLLSDDVKRYIDTFLDMILPHVTVFHSFTAVVDPKFLRAMPHIIDSPYAQVDPVMLVIYYSAIYYGQSIGTEGEKRLGTRTYYLCLQSVPKWLESAKGTQLDVLAASMAAWLAINNFDYHLAWQFHREACRFGDLQGIHNVDLSPARSPEEEAAKETQRRLHWFLVDIDFLFMTWYDKPRALRCPPTQVRLPAIISPATSQPKRGDCALFIVWSRALFILDDYFNAVETLTDEELVRQVDHCCNQLIELHDDWDLSSVARSPKLGQFECWMYAETVIAFHSIIIIMRRKIMAADQAAHPQAVQSARAIISIIHEWSRKDLAPYGGDICTLETLVRIITDVASVRPDFAPIANALGALNDVSRAVHSGRAPAQGLTQGDAQVPPQPNPDLQPLPPFESMQSLSADVSLQAQPQFDDTFGIPFELQHQIAFDWDPEAGGRHPARPGTGQTLSQPVDFVRAIESELIWRNWHESWWN
ncbi:hypothetical protein ASPSYDRAFT_61332 [Aspergillus sydowii CBS 593.65]|uniref:Zn(2)-C6 fungal-type domain-containing protein n=1 Tax=Aspergillus sydowii CBS 593.65 TaxID=1036612 RepID=A0A1L9T5U6_9EURO|nr:uncharacterized protein ASPSYDRAFT_61332 [Aspergillus sydowii CBS 593.65]OJJ54830.1 hypothetical protein ASPSYDRAFT_61332 [Aspergillus sydowii CBS 593.65]